MTSASGEVLYEGKAKIVRAGATAAEVEVQFKDDATAFDGTKKDTIRGKGRLNGRISARLFEHLERHGVKTHFIEALDERTHRVRRLEMVPVEVVVRNVAAGSLVRRYGIEEGRELAPPVVEFYLKDDSRHDPMITEDHIRVLGLADPATVAELRARALVIDRILSELFGRVGLTLVDFKLEFGRAGGELYLGDEISPDTCRLWDAGTGEKLDKDRFRFDLGDLVTGYAEVERRVQEIAP